MTSAPWPAPLATGPLDATVDVPGSKSLTNRHLVLSALAASPTLVRGALRSRDGELMVGALAALGAGVRTEPRAPGVWDVTVTPGPLRGGRVDCGLAGTVMRFVPPLAVLSDGDVHLDGDPAARRRPIGPIVDGLRALGADVDAATDGADEGGGGEGGAPVLPLTVHGTGSFAGGEVAVDASGSSQFVSGLLLAAPAWERGVTITHTGRRVPSMPHVEMTLHALRERGVDARVAATDADGAATSWRVEPGPVDGGEVVIEPDLSNAAVFLAAAMIAGGTVRVPRWPAASAQPFAEVREALTRIGADVRVEGDELVVTGPGVDGLRPVDADLGRIGELTPTIAALCVLARGTSRLRGVAHLRGHETDRLAALTTEITRLGGRCTETPDGLEIDGAGPDALRGALMETYEDHRMATFAALVGLAVPGVTVADVGTTAKTLPEFTDRWAALPGGGR